MDILGSIMKRMERPPAVDEKERTLRQQRKIAWEKERAEKERRVRELKSNLSKRVDEFVSDPERDRIAFEPMDKFTRAILHEVAEGAGLFAHSFGQEEVDRHVVLFKEEPIDAELLAMRRGDDFDPLEEPADDEEPSEEDSLQRKRKRRGGGAPGGEKYLEKYEKHLGGSLSVAKDAAMSTKAESSKAYGFVRSDQKMDKRTIEETLKDIRDKKKMKTSNSTTSSTASSSSASETNTADK